MQSRGSSLKKTPTTKLLNRFMNGSGTLKKIANVPMHLLVDLNYHGNEIVTSVLDQGKSCHHAFLLNNLCVVSVPEFWQYKYKVFRVE